MKEYIKIITYTLFIAGALFAQQLNGQSMGKYTNSTPIGVPASGNTNSGSLNFITPCTSFEVSNGNVWVQLDLGEDYELGNQTSGIDFTVTANIDLTVRTISGTEPTVNFEVILSNDKPEGVIYLNLNQYIDAANTSTGLSYDDNSVTSVLATINSVTELNGNIDIINRVRIGLYNEVDYKLKVDSNTISNLNYIISETDKVVHFSWDDSCQAPNYEFQLLRLYNKDAQYVSDEHEIKTSIDWSKALTFETESSATEIDITVGEGQGYYIWRVRPIGTYFENGIGNSKNWGLWNSTDYTTGSYVIDEAIETSSNEIFFFTDLDDQTNYQYSRVFTEGNKISEQVTYATTLNQVKQTQRYFPSKDYKIVSQTVLDNSGRPTLTTLPVPVDGEKINKYKNSFVTTNAELYRAKHFDQESNYKQPAVIDATGAFSYYSGANADKRIPSAEGYPYTRVIFSNDGTDRVVEQSGVGKTHMIGDQSSGQGRTVRTLYDTPTAEELIALFGDEAPNHQDVAKVITIDPNNTSSVAFITKEGQTIATGLTFSDDEDVLDKVNSNAIVAEKTDQITNNIKIEGGFKSSKRLTILQDSTSMNIDYVIGKPVLEGLCHNLEIDLDYELIIDVFDVATGTVVKNFSEPSIAQYLNNPGDKSIHIDFGEITLPEGSYYVQKTLKPSNSVTAELVSSEDNIRRLIEPYFNWLVSALKEVDCEEEMQYLYNDLFYYGQKVYNQQLAANDGVLEFDCTDCSGISTVFKKKDPLDAEAPDEFLDYYVGREDQYGINILYFDEQGDIQSIDYATVSNLGNIKPIEVQFTTPCCSFNVPVVFTPPFRKPSPEALEAYKNDATADSQLNNSINYYNPTSNIINPNPRFLTIEGDNLQYTQDSQGNVIFQNKNAYPIDFEGYAISMLYECQSSANPDYDIEDAKATFYSHMRGWHEPGLFNQMIYHMATDSYGQNGCKNRFDGSGERSTPDIGSINNPAPEDGYHICDIDESPVYLEGAQYSMEELAKCWEPIVIEMVNKICVEAYEADFDQSTNISSNVDDQDVNNEDIHDDHFDDNIKNFIVRWISKRKLRRKVRKKNIGTSPDIKDEVEKFSNNMVNAFLNCTGYVFADIVDTNNPTNNFTEFTADFDGDVSNGEYNKERLVDGSIGSDWAYFTLDPTTQGQEYIQPPGEGEPEETGIIKEVFPNLQDPVYAFKYYHYIAGTFPDLEGETCFRDPNICIDPQTGEEVPCAGGTVEEPVLCNFCGLGYISCPYTRESWSCDQRYTFYEMIKNYQETSEPEGVPVTCGNYYEATAYVHNPDFGKEYDSVAGNSSDFELRYTNIDLPLDTFIDLPYLSESLITTYVSNKSFSDLQSEGGVVELTDINGDTQTNGVSIIENDAYHMQQDGIQKCEQRRNEFRQQIIKAFEERCYVIGECKIDPNDNIIPEADIELMVEQMVEQCKAQTAITTYSCVDEPCRLITKSPYEFGGSPEASNDFNTSYIDYGVSGPIVSGRSNRETQTLKEIDPLTGDVVDSGESAIVTNISATGTLEKYEYTSSPSIWDMRRSLTYAEYSRWIQAMEWDIQLDVPSKCDAQGNYNADLTYDSNGIPVEPVYVQNEQGLWLEQNFEMCDMPYISRDNPTGPGDTFVERDAYIKNNTTPVTPENSSLSEEVESPKTGIHITVQP